MVRDRSQIVIVEDDDAAREGLAALLEDAGYAVRSTATFAEGRQLLAEQAPDLLIADVRLGRYNGLQLVATAPRLVSSIIVTGFPDPALEVEALKFGAHYITKPIAVEPFLALLETIVSARRHQSRRLWNRKSAIGKVAAEVEHAQARVVNISYGGIKFEIERDQSLPPSFRITVASPGLSIDASLVWGARSDDRHWVCGAAISLRNAAAVHDWARLVDAL